MSVTLKPSLTAYADELRVFKEIDELASQAAGLSDDTQTKIRNLAHAISQAEDSALTDRQRGMQEGGTNAWQKANAEPFIVVARQAKDLLEDEGFTQELVNSSIPVPDPKNHRLVSASRDYESMTTSFSLIEKATAISTLLHQEETAKGHPLQERDLGRHCLSPGNSPFAPV